MDFAGINLLAVLIAAIGSFLFGGVWYGIFSRQWLAAAGLQAPVSKGGGWQTNAVPFIVAFAAQLLMAYVLAGVIGHLGAGKVNLRNGILSGAFVWAGFVMTSLLVNHTFQGAKRALTIIDGGHWLGVLVIQGAAIGAAGI
ncbi:MAG: DUF1761 family protein [Hyphomicrobiaceae bacterium]|nr:DUF1761 family protein [Hyphomicrobiaceae bacterium]